MGSRISSIFLGVALLPLAVAAEPPPAPPDLSGNDPRWTHDEKSDCWAFHQSTVKGFTFTWTGACKDKLVDGDGVLTWFFGSKQVETYEGHLATGRAEGLGKETWRTESVYEGMFHAGFRGGRGKLTIRGGTTDEGLFAHDRLNGPGKRTFASGDVLEGGFVDGAPTGSVTLRRTDGTTATGDIVLARTDPQITPWPIDYPQMAMRLNETGWALVTFTVTANGGTRDVRVTHSTGYSRLDDAALNYVKSWMFLPATIGGRPVALETERSVNFKIP
jgi:TonB family protein